MRPLTCLLLIAAASAVETKPVPVLRVIDGNTIEVGAVAGGVQVPVRVRLLYVRCPPHDADPNGVDWSKSDLVGTLVTLHAPGDEFRPDAAGSIPALVILPQHWHNEEDNHHVDLTSLSIMGGGGVYWPDEPRVPPETEKLFKDLEAMAREGRQGAWDSARQWMQEKADERSAAEGKP